MLSRSSGHFALLSGRLKVVFGMPGMGRYRLSYSAYLDVCSRYQSLHSPSNTLRTGPKDRLCIGVTPSSINAWICILVG